MKKPLHGYSNILKKIFSIFNLKNFLKVRFLFGYYYDGNATKLNRFLRLLYCISFVITGIYVYLIDKNFADIGFFKALLPVKYSMQMLLSLYAKEVYFIGYNAGIKTLDNLVHYDREHFDPYISITSMSVLVVFKHIYQTALNVEEVTLTFKNICESLLKTSNYLCGLPRLIIFEMLWTRMRFIRRKLKRSSENKSVFEKSYAIKKFLHAYKFLLDNYGRTNYVVKITMTIELIYYFIKTVNYNQIAISHVLREGFNTLAYFYILQSCFGLYSVVLTPVFQELIMSEYDNIKSVLGNELIVCEDEDLRRVLYVAINYLEVRPPTRSLWRILPMDVKFVITFLSAIITYIIIIVSFNT